ncbi:tapasin-like, partial [Cynoglossus semilaevis]|uniref:tapasin-like n=1 Tax=Cynoglossus semilaevis TaxID=244447 RepID=UPI000495107F
MTDFSTIYKLTLVAVSCFVQVSSSSSRSSSSSCPPLECWFMKEKTGGGFRAQQQKSLLHIRTDENSPTDDSEPTASDVGADRVFFITDPAASLCHHALTPAKGSLEKPLCEMNPFQQQPSHLKWVAPLTGSGLSPPYLQADWLALTVKGRNKQLSVSTIMRAPTGTEEPKVILSVTTKTVQVQARLGESVVLDCGYWVDPSSPLSGSGFAVEWRYQFRGRGRLILAYDGKLDRLADVQDQDATMDFEALHKTGNASLILQEAKVRHSGMYICTTYLPYLQTQVAMELEIIEPPSL